MAQANCLGKQCLLRARKLDFFNAIESAGFNVTIFGSIIMWSASGQHIPSGINTCSMRPAASFEAEFFTCFTCDMILK